MRVRNAIIIFISLVFLCGPSMIDEANADQCSNLGVVLGGTFLLNYKGKKAVVTSYIPNGTVVCINDEKTINHYKVRNEAPIKQEYYQITTVLGKQGFILKSEIDQMTKYKGKFIFPRTEITIYKPSFIVESEKMPTTQELVDLYNGGKLPKEYKIKLSSTYPKDKKPLKVLGLTESQDFYEVTAEFLGDNVKGYIDTRDIWQGRADVIDSDNIVFLETEWTSRHERFESFFRKFIKNENHRKMIEEQLTKMMDSMTLCRGSIEIGVRLEFGPDIWWVEAKVRVDGKTELKPKYRDYEYNSLTINRESGTTDEVEVMKYIKCDDDRMLYPVLFKVKVRSDDNYEILEIPRDNMSSLSGYRGEKDIVIGEQYKTVLTIRNYNEWLEVHKHFCDSLSTISHQEEYIFPLLVDVLIDTVTYYPPSALRK